MLPDALGEEKGKQAWYAVRTDSFKKWFGDWEIEAVADWLITAESVKELTGNEFKKSETDTKKQIQDYFRENYESRVERSETGTIVLSNSGIRSRFSHKNGLNRNTIAAFAAVPEIIMKGKIYNLQKHWKGRGYDTLTIGAPIKIGAEEYIAEVIIKKSGKDSSYYLHKVEIKSKLHGALRTGSDTSAPGGTSKLSIAQKLEEVKGKVSQVRDANGEPLAVYHGTDADFDVLDREKQGVTRDYIKRCFYRLLPGSR